MPTPQLGAAAGWPSWRLRGLALCGVFLLATAPGCARRATTPSTRPVLRVARGFAPLSIPLTAEYKRRMTEVDVQSINAGDSYDVISSLENNTADVGIALADVAYSAYWGKRGARLESPTSPIRGVSLLQPLSAYVLVRAQSGIHQLSDLDGRRVGLGSPTSSSSNLAYQLFDAFKVKPKLETFSARSPAIARITDGTIDAIFLPGYVYPDEETYAAIRKGAYLIPIEGPPLERLRWDNPFVRVATIPRDIYPGQDQMIPTVGIDMVVLCRRDLDEQLVHAITAQLFDAYPRLSGVEAMLKFLSIDEAPATPIPLHAGAARYFRERELSR